MFWSGCATSRLESDPRSSHTAWSLTPGAATAAVIPTLPESFEDVAEQQGIEPVHEPERTGAHGGKARGDQRPGDRTNGGTQGRAGRRSSDCAQAGDFCDIGCGVSRLACE